VSEEWRPVPGFEGLYEVSSQGRVRSVDHYAPVRGGSVRLVRGRIRKLQTGSGGYLKLMLSKGNVITNHEVHALVAAAFHGARPPGMEVCHNNGDQSDNRAENLRYGTHSDNIRDAIKHGTHYSHFRMAAS